MRPRSPITQNSPSLASSTRDGFVEIVVRKHPGGLCSGQLTALEPGRTVRAFLRRNPAFRTIPAVPAEIGAPDEALTAEGWLRILPSQWAERGGVDGFFVAKLERVEG